LYRLGKNFRMLGEGFAERILVDADLSESVNEGTVADERVSERGTESALGRRVGEITLEPRDREFPVDSSCRRLMP
jgi:hypothetical protein